MRPALIASLRTCLRSAESIAPSTRPSIAGARSGAAAAAAMRMQGHGLVRGGMHGVIAAAAPFTYSRALSGASSSGGSGVGAINSSRALSGASSSGGSGVGGGGGINNSSSRNSSSRSSGGSSSGGTGSSSSSSSSDSSGGRAKLPIVHHPSYSAPLLPPGHRFPMQVFDRIYDRLLHHHRLIGPDQVHTPPHLPDDATLCLVHTQEYVDAFSNGRLDEQRVRRIGLGAITSQPILVERTKAEVAGTLLTARLALQHGLACNTAGGTHHAYPGFGSGFCILNDLAVTVRLLQAEGAVKKVLILDLDVHQGDGTAAIFQDDPSVFTLSVHCESNFPARKQSSSLDIGLRDGVQDTEYLSCVGEVLPSVLVSFRPDLVLYDAGVDVHTDDNLGRLEVSDDGLRRRELLVLDTCLGYGVPVAGFVGGGYHTDLDVLADRHIHLHRAAQQMWEDHGLG